MYDKEAKIVYYWGRNRPKYQRNRILNSEREKCYLRIYFENYIITHGIKYSRVRTDTNNYICWEKGQLFSLEEFQ